MNIDGIARPYSKAVFEIAKENNELSLWVDCIDTLSKVVLDEDFQSYTQSPNVSKDEVLGLVEEVFKKGKLPKGFQSFVQLLIENDRLEVMAAIHDQVLKSILLDTQVRQAEVSVVKELSDKQLKTLSQALEKRYNCKIEVRTKVLPNILGGAVIRMDDDTVFDGSLTTRLEKLEYLLSH